MSDIERFQILNDVWVRYDDHRAEVERLKELLTAAQQSISEMIDSATGLPRATVVHVNSAQAEHKRLTAERDEALARVHWFQADLTQATTKVKRVIAERDEAQSTIYRLAGERDAAQAEVGRLKEQVGALSLAVEQADEAKADAEAAAAAEEAETDRVMSERDAAQAEVERLTVRLEHAEARIVPPLPHADESAQQVQDKMDGYIASLTTELHETREKLARVQVQYDEFAKVTAKVIDQHQRERDHARQQAYLLREAGANRPSDEDIWREAFMRQLHDVLPNWATTADAALAQYRKRWPR